jgi:hypothetical protein
MEINILPNQIDYKEKQVFQNYSMYNNFLIDLNPDIDMYIDNKLPLWQLIKFFLENKINKSL